MLKCYGTSSPEMSHHGTELSTIRFQQDGATAHTAKAPMEVIREKLPEHVTSLHGELPWLAHLPDPSACDYFLWGYLKAGVDTTRPQTINHNSEANFSNTRKHGEVSTGKPVNKVGRGVHNDEKHLTDVLFKTK
jgi:hypothetical protein